MCISQTLFHFGMLLEEAPNKWKIRCKADNKRLSLNVKQITKDLALDKLFY